MSNQNNLESEILLNASQFNQEDFLSQILISNYNELRESIKKENNEENNNIEINNNNNNKEENSNKKITKIKENTENNHNTTINNSDISKDNKKIKKKKKYNDIAFNRLKELQKLYKKESALKELFIQTREKIKTNINQYCIDICKKKLEVRNILQKINSQNLDEEDKKKAILYEDKSYLSNLNNYVPKFLTFLWENPNIVAEILLNAEIQDVKEILAPFISNNFYENILSPSYIEDHLMYVNCILLKDEINKMKSQNDFTKFLCSTVCGTMMSQIAQKNDIQEYFKSILEEVIEQIEMTCSNKKMTFKIKEIEEQIQEKNKEKFIQNSKNNIKNKNKSKNKNKFDKKETIEDMFNCDVTAKSFNLSLSFLSFDEDFDVNKINKINEKTKEEDFSKLYNAPMNKELLEKLIIENQFDKKINDYLVLQFKKMGDDKDIYSNQKFKDKVFHSNMSNQIIQSYQHDFINIITFIERIIDLMIIFFLFHIQ